MITTEEHVGTYDQFQAHRRATTPPNREHQEMMLLEEYYAVSITVLDGAYSAETLATFPRITGEPEMVKLALWKLQLRKWQAGLTLFETAVFHSVPYTF